MLVALFYLNDLCHLPTWTWWRICVSEQLAILVALKIHKFIMNFWNYFYFQNIKYLWAFFNRVKPLVNKYNTICIMVFNNKGFLKYRQSHVYGCFCLNLRCAFGQYKKLEFHSNLSITLNYSNVLVQWDGECINLKNLHLAFNKLFG